MDNYAKVGGVEINIDEKQIKEVAGDVANKAEKVAGDIVEAPMFYTVIRLIFRYLIMGFTMSVASYMLQSKRPQWREVIMLGITAASVMMILEVYMGPDAFLMAKWGFGWSIGKALTAIV